MKLSGPRWQARWNATRRAVLERDGYRCVQCGKAGRLEVDHIVPRFQAGAEWDLNNLQTLCRDCHGKKTASENRRPLGPEQLAWAELVREKLNE